MQARFYQPTHDHAAWEALCEHSINGTFLHTRAFLGYHRDRFIDRSVVIERDHRLLAVLPAASLTEGDGTVTTHPGATFGGFVHRGDLCGERMLEAFKQTSRLFRGAGFRSLAYRVVPHIYHRAPAEDDLYALHRLMARRVGCGLSSSIDLAHRLPASTRRRRALRKAGFAALTLSDSTDLLEPYWTVLQDNLAARHGSQPVHSLSEIQALFERFPACMALRVARVEGRVAAGVVLFKSGTTVHAQYLASNDDGRATSALDLVITECIAEASGAGARFFDFGISTEEHGRRLNTGLNDFKNEFGATGVIYETYELDLKSHHDD